MRTPFALLSALCACRRARRPACPRPLTGHSRPPSDQYKHRYKQGYEHRNKHLPKQSVGLQTIPIATASTFFPTFIALSTLTINVGYTSIRNILHSNKITQKNINSYKGLLLCLTILESSISIAHYVYKLICNCFQQVKDGVIVCNYHFKAFKSRKHENNFKSQM